MEREYKNYKLKKCINPVIKICSICICLFFGIMWTSFLWLPKSKEEFQVTKLNMPMTDNNYNRVLTLTRWDYSEADELMEIQLRMENKNFDGMDQYVWSAVDRYKGRLTTEAVYSDEEILVVQIKDVPQNWSTISLRMAFQGNDPDTEFLFKMYGDSTNITEVNTISTLDRNGYYILDISNTIAFYQEEIEVLETDIAEEQEKIKEIGKSIDNTAKKLQYMTEQEEQIAVKEIDSLQSMAEAHSANIQDNEELIAEYEKRISNLQEKMKSYQ